MCLSNIDFALSYDKSVKDVIGYGYKQLSESKVSLYKKKWVEAIGYHKNNVFKSEKESSTDGKFYIPGFHIFLNQKDAENYTQGGRIIRVKFRGVLAYGRNATNFGEGLCIIARYMKFIEYVDKKSSLLNI